MKILWFSNTPAAGDEYVSSNGSGGWLKSLDKAIQDQVELHVVFHDRGYPEEFKVGKTTYHCVASNSLRQRIKDKLISLKGRTGEVERCVEIVERVKPDIVHIHGTEAIWIKTVEFIHDIPVVLSIQAIVTVMMHKYYSGLLKKDTPFFSHYRKVGRFYDKRAYDERKFVKQVPFLLGRTEWDRRVYKVLAPHAKYYVSNEVLRDGFYCNEWKDSTRDDGKLIIHTTTGTLLFKGLETICQTVNLLNRIGMSVEWRVAGVDEKNEYVEIVRRKLKHDYPEKGLLLLGSLKEDELIERMLEAHVFVSPSHQDNSPNALCEATMLGMPCISTCAGGSSTIVKDGITGILVQDGDPWSMAGAIIEMANDRFMANKYAKEARKEAVVRHDKKTIVESLVEVYQVIASS